MSNGGGSQGASGVGRGLGLGRFWVTGAHWQGAAQSMRPLPLSERIEGPLVEHLSATGALRPSPAL